MKERKMYLKRNGLRQTGEDGTIKRGKKRREKNVKKREYEGSATDAT